MNCKYEDARLSFFSPNNERSISSLDPQFERLHAALRTLEENSFQLTMSPYGEILELHKLDEIIEDAFGLDDSEENEMLRNSVLESFGSTAVRNLASIILKIYARDYPAKNEIQTQIYLNAKPAIIRNKFYYQPTDEQDLRVQGIGVIPEQEDSFPLEEMLLKTTLKGSQTFDYLVNGSSGWITRGMSKQKIHTLSEIEGGENLPRGLKIPALTSTEYKFRGKKAED